MEQIYYKITNKTECHNGFQYVDGLNILDKPFERDGSNVAGGLYFTTAKYIFNFLYRGCYLREITLPKDCQWVRDWSWNKFRADKIILGKKYDLADPFTFQLLLERGADVHASGDRALIWASKNGYGEIVKLLVDAGANIYADGNCALWWASKHGNLEIVKYLVKSGAHIGNCYIIDYLNDGILENNPEIFKYFVENITDIYKINDCVLKYALEYGHLKVVEYLNNLKNDVNNLKNDVNNLKNDVNNLKNDVKNNNK